MQAWWQRKVFLSLGMIGAVIYIVQPIIASAIWPVYKAISYPVAVLTATDASYASAFHGLQLIAGGLVVVFLLAWWQLAQHERDFKLRQNIQQLLISWAVMIILQFAWPLTTMAQGVIFQGVTPRGIVFGFLSALLSWSLWQVGQTTQQSLANMLHLLAILYLLFQLLMFGMGIIGWPVRGFFDMLSIDVLAGAIGFASWYYTRQAA